MDEPGKFLGIRLDELRSLLDELSGRWRGDAVRIGEGTKARLQELFREVGLITRADWDELDLRIAQLEHRLRMLEEPKQ
jgi:polyhydroxyalkanoate synthesis regulator phasin